MLYGLLALVSLAAAAGTFYMYRGAGSIVYLVLAIISVIAMVAFGALFLSGRVNKTEDIHITE